MNSNAFRLPARRLGATVAATVLAAAPATLVGASTAHATGDEGKASAVVLRTGLDVSLLNKTVNVPLAVSLNDVQAPASADKTALTATLDGVEGGKPFTVLRADVAQARATVEEARAEGSTHLARARVNLPGLPLLSLIEVEKVTARALCAVGRQPVAEANVLGHVTVLGKKVTLTAGGVTEVAVPGVGEVRIDLSERSTTSRTAAATALELKVSVNPLKLNVAEVNGTVTLAGATCATPAAPAEQPAKPEPSEAPEQPAKPEGPAKPEEPGTKPQTGPGENLAETGGSSTTPYLAGGAALLVAGGAGALYLTRRARRQP
ncbi:SCO1860 family LAETG-anchored protein [Streptomyces sp. NPDC002490]|uniref:SCO1860 family LAETG-anchored protein n=1 Tax=Streptomyces sp. NPDC002490 TaxID=3154416 RepID=UPI00331EE4E5